jgi:hypothetical protein
MSDIKKIKDKKNKTEKNEKGQFTIGKKEAY